MAVSGVVLLLTYSPDPYKNLWGDSQQGFIQNPVGFSVFERDSTTAYNIVQTTYTMYVNVKSHGKMDFLMLLLIFFSLTIYTLKITTMRCVSFHCFVIGLTGLLSSCGMDRRQKLLLTSCEIWKNENFCLWNVI